MNDVFEKFQKLDQKNGNKKIKFAGIVLLGFALLGIAVSLLLSGRSAVNYIGAGISFLIGAYTLNKAYSYLYNPKNAQTCNVSMWSKTVVANPSEFIPDEIGVESICEAQKMAEHDKEAVAFIAYSNGMVYDVLFITDTGFTARESATDTGYTLYHTKEAKVSLTKVPLSLTPPTDEEDANLSSKNGCPAAPYQYCPQSTPDTVYILSGCPSSDKISKKLNSTKIVNCSDSENAQECFNLDNQNKYPAVKCADGSLTVGYCD